MKGNILLISVLITGLSAGLFYAWQVSVIPGTRKLTDAAYLASMQSINLEILNPWFFVIFFGPMLLMIVSSIGLYKTGHTEIFVWLILAAINYTIGTIGVTAFGNVPLNNALDILDLSTLSLDELRETRLAYEAKWNLYHFIRTSFAVISFGLLLWLTKIHFSNTIH